MVARNAAQNLNLKPLLACTYSRCPQRTNTRDIRGDDIRESHVIL